MERSPNVDIHKANRMRILKRLHGNERLVPARLQQHYITPMPLYGAGGVVVR
jgi:hypothetical protein